jgi:glutathione S-transferase
MSGDNEYVLGYWSIKGLAAPIRMAFAYAGIAYRDEMFAMTEVDGRWRSAWPLRAKEMLANGDSSFPNLPFLIIPAGEHGERKVVMQSGAILRFVGQLGGLMGTSPIESLLVDELLEQTMDLRNEMVRVVYGADFQEMHESFATKSLPYYFGAFEKYLHQHSAGAVEGAPLFYVGGRVSVADLAIADALSIASSVAARFLDVATLYPLVTRHVAQIRELPQLQGYYDGPLSKLAPNNVMASWGNMPL